MKSPKDITKEELTPIFYNYVSYCLINTHKNYNSITHRNRSFYLNKKGIIHDFVLDFRYLYNNNYYYLLDDFLEENLLNIVKEIWNDAVKITDGASIYDYDNNTEAIDKTVVDIIF